MNEQRRRWIQLLLFVVTLLTTTISGAEWIFGTSIVSGNLGVDEFISGLQYSIPFLLILTCHEFGHYLVARYYNIAVTLPSYIPFWLPGFPAIGTMGAYIQIKEAIQSRKEYFDVGVAGPLAGFVVAMGFIIYGFSNLPEIDYIYEVHPDYESFGKDYPMLYEMDTVLYKKDFVNPNRYNFASMPDSIVYDRESNISITLGDNLIFWYFENYWVEDVSRLPHPNEIIHYPFLLAGYLALLFTALNLLPIGQLDGGHVIFGLFGERHSRTIARVLFVVFLFYAGLGVIHPGLLVETSSEASLQFLLMVALYLYYLYACLYSMIEGRRDRLMVASIILATQFVTTLLLRTEGYMGWMVFAFIIGRFLGVYHPPVNDNRDLSTTRKIIGVIALVVFILSFSPRPLIIN